MGTTSSKKTKGGFFTLNDTSEEDAARSKKKKKRQAIGSDAKKTTLLTEAINLSSEENIDLVSEDVAAVKASGARTKGGQAELTRLLTLFENRKTGLSQARARPGINQTRLV